MTSRVLASEGLIRLGRKTKDGKLVRV